MEACLEAHARGKDSGFKFADWSKIEERYNKGNGPYANKQQLQNQLNELRGFCNMYGYIVNQLGGFSVDPDTGLPTASDKCWEDFMKAHPKAGRFKTKPFAGKIATGQFAILLTGSTKRKSEENIVADDSGDKTGPCMPYNDDSIIWHTGP